ncbi:MAG: GyrI-like domain-containing protein [Ginsengibacter sp.]
MKKLLLGVFVLGCVALVGIYLFIPAKIKLSKLITIKTNPSVAGRFLMDGNQWVKWSSPDAINAPDAKTGKVTFKFKNHYYHVDRAIMNNAQVSISNTQRSINSLMALIPIKEDAVAIEWKAEIDAGPNPISRIKSYTEAKKLGDDMSGILSHLKAFLEKKENAYGLNITEQQVADTILISTKYLSDTLPSTAKIYSLINGLRKYITKEGALETNAPMLNINKESSTYRTMVAIPINKMIPEKNNYVFKRMVPGRILVAEVKGGDYTARHALKQLDLYIDDNHLSSPAIPFQSLITDRSMEPDTTKWITKIYYPVY